MSDNDARQLSRVQDDARYANDDEISLVDLAKILIKRWKLMAITFGLIVLIALAYALLLERTYEYVSIYQVAEQAPSENREDSALESPASVVAKTTNLYLGAVTRDILRDQARSALPAVTINHPDSTLLVTLSSQAAEADEAVVEALHGQVLARIREDQLATLAQRREALSRQLASAESALALAKQSTSPSAAELVASYAERAANIEDRLAQLQEGQVVQTAVQSLKPTGTSRSLIMALAIVLGGMLAVMMAFFSQFAVAVRESLADE